MKTLLLFLSLTFCSWGQSVVAQPGSFNQALQTRPGTIPTTLTCLVGFSSSCIFKLPTNSSDPYLCALDFTATGQTLTMQDANGVLWIVAGGALGSAGTPVGWEWHSDTAEGCRWFPGGVYIQANAVGATGKFSIKYQK